MKKFCILIMLLMFGLPGFSKVIVLNGLTHIQDGQQGNVLEAEILVQNIGDKQERILIYLNDLVQYCDTEPSYTEPGTQPRSSGLWFELNSSDEILDPQEEFAIKYKITIPEGESVKGSYWSIVMIEIVDPIKEDQLEYGLSMDSKIRYGIQVITNVGNMEESEIVFEGVSINDMEEGHLIEATAHNTGDFLVTPTVILELYDQSAELVAKTEVPFKKVYPNSCKSFEVPIEKLIEGSYDALLVADYGKGLYGTNLQIDIE